MVRNSCVIALAFTFTGNVIAYASPSAEYNPQSGEIWVNDLYRTTRIAQLDLYAKPGQLLIEGAYEAISDQAIAFGGFELPNNGDHYSWRVGNVSSTVWLGNVVALGTPATDLELRYIYILQGEALRSIDAISLPIAVVPEPAGGILLLLGMALMMVCRLRG